MASVGYCSVCGRTVYIEKGDEPRCPVCQSPVEAAFMHESKAERIGRNEALARELNEGIKKGLSVEIREVIVILCECGREDCSATIAVSPEVYEQVRHHPARFIVAKGHEVGEVEEAIGRHNGYVIVEKVGEAAEVAEELDPT
jgi:hypothetical protein